MRLPLQIRREEFQVKTELLDLNADYSAAIERAAEIIKSGGTVVFPTETVYGLGADAMDPEAVKKIFIAKGRPQDNPLIVHIARREDIYCLAKEVSDDAKTLIDKFWPGPLTAVVKKADNVPKEVTAGLDTVGVRMPALKCARDLIEKSGCFIAAPSANLSGKPSTTRAQHAIDDMYGRVDAILIGPDCEVGMESTVCGLAGDIPTIYRPGGITAEMIADTVGRVKVHGAVLEGLSNGTEAVSPGMKYKHYAPKAQVVVVDGNSADAIAKKIKMLYDIDKCSNRAVIVCPSEFSKLYEGANIRVFESSQDIAHKLFDILRDADNEGMEKIYFHAVKTQGLGLAIMNRVIRAAGFNVI